MITKGNPITSALLLIACSFVSSGSLHGDEETHPAQTKKESYELQISQAKILHTEQLHILSKQYLSALESSATELQKQGDLDGLLAVNAELKQFNESGIVPTTNTDETHATVIKLRQIYNDSQTNAYNAKLKTTTELTEQYSAYLEELQKKLTQDGKLEQALLVKTEATKIQNFKSGLPALKPTDPAATTQTSKPNILGNSPLSLLVEWNHSRPETLMGSDRRAVPNYKFNHQGGNTISKDGTLSMVGGRTLLEGLNSKILTSCKASQQWSLVLHFESASLDQKGPARIFSYSQDSKTRNFTLGQENDQLILRLRTTKTGNNGSGPQVNLGKIKEGKLYKIALTYEPDKLNCYLDGKAVPVQQISGDFSNWQEHNLVLGNEWKDERPWKGKFHQFALYSSALTEDDAITQTR